MNGLNSLLAITRSLEFEEDGDMRVTVVRWKSHFLHLEFDVNDGAGGKSRWEAAFGGVLEYDFPNVYGCGLNVWRGRHPAIHQYTQAHEQLHFSAPPPDPDQVVGQLWETHRRVTDDWIPFDRYLNLDLPLAKRLATRSGVLATGPAFLIDAYAKVLKRHGCRPSRVVAKRRKHPTRALIAHFSESYVVAETLTVKLLEST